MKILFRRISSAIAICCCILTACGAPDNSENGIVTPHDLSAEKSVKDITAGQHDVIHRVKTKGIGMSLGKAFNDKNDLQLSAAEKIGITPIHSLRDAYHIAQPLKKIGTCDEFQLDTLTHSMPYLVPKAEQLLRDIGKAFTDSVLARGGRKCLIRVTSVLRTDNTIKSLRRRNVNATDASCHMYGTTFDISWIRFHHSDSTYIMYTEDLKNILGEVLYEMKQQGRCYVKFERKQSCFHITAR